MKQNRTKVWLVLNRHGDMLVSTSRKSYLSSLEDFRERWNLHGCDIKEYGYTIRQFTLVPVKKGKR